MSESDNKSSGTYRPGEVLGRIDGMDYYGVRLHVQDADFDEGRIEIDLLHDDAGCRNGRTDLYYGEPYYGGEERWRCSLTDNYAVVDKALDLLNERSLQPGGETDAGR